MEALKEGLLKVEPGLLLWTIICFLTLVLLLWKTAWKPIIEALDARAERIRGDIENAEKSRLESEELLKKHQELLAKAKEETAKIVSEGKASAEKIRAEMLDKASVDAKDISERAKREISLAKEKAVSELKGEIVNIAVEVASKIIVKSLKPEDHKDLVEEALKKIDHLQ